MFHNVDHLYFFLPGAKESGITPVYANSEPEGIIQVHITDKEKLLSRSLIRLREHLSAQNLDLCLELRDFGGIPNCKLLNNSNGKSLPVYISCTLPTRHLVSTPPTPGSAKFFYEYEFCIPMAENIRNFVVILVDAENVWIDRFFILPGTFVGEIYKVFANGLLRVPLEMFLESK